MNKKVLFARLAAFSAAASAGSAFAAGVDYSTLTSAFDLGTTQTAVMAIAAVLAGLYVAIRGAKTVLSMIRGR